MEQSHRATAFGQQMRSWRRRRGLSQLDLALEASVSQRHISFLETGRSRPRSDIIHRLSEALDIPLRERNQLLIAAGLAPTYPEMPLMSEAIAPFRAAIAKMLEAQEPYPAIVMNRWWEVVDANVAAQRMLPMETAEPLCFVDAFFGGPLAGMIDNFDAVAWAVLRRLRREASASLGDEKFADMIARAEKAMEDRGPEEEPVPLDTDLVVCPHLRFGDRIIKTISVVARFGNTREVTLDELQVELMFPQDEEAETFFRELAALAP